MAGRKEFELLFKLQAALGSNFTSSFNNAMSVTKKLQGNLSQINTLSGKIDGFQKQSAALQQNKDKLAQLTAEHDRLQREISQTEQPSEALRQKMERNARQIEQTTAKIEQQEARLGKLGNELRDAGIDTDNLTDENKRLAESYERVKKSQEKIASIEQAQQKNAEAISRTRTQLLGTIGALTAAGAAAVAMMNNTASATDRVDKLSQKIGISRKAFQEWDFILSQSGTDIEKMQTGMKTLVQRMGEQAAGSGTGAAAFKKLQVSATNANGELKQQEEVFEEVVRKMQEMPASAEKSQLAFELFGKAGTELMPLLNSVGGSVEDMKKRAEELGIVLSDDAINAGVAYTDAMDQMKRAISATSQQVMVALMPVVTEAAKKIGTLAGRVSQFARENPELISTIAKVAAGLAGLKVGALAGKLAFLQVKGGIIAVQGAFAKLQGLRAAGGLKSLFSGLGGIKGKLLPIVGIIGGVALAIKLISGNLDEVRGWIQKTFGDGALAVFDKVWGVIQNVGAAIKGIFSGENIGNARSFFEEHFGEAGVAVFDALIGVVEQLKGILPGLLDQFAQLASSLLPVIGSLIQQLLPVIGEIIASVLPVLFNLLAQILPLIGNVIEAVLPVLIQLAQTLVPIIMQIIEAVLPVLQQLLESIMPLITQIIESVLPVVIDLITTVVSAIQPLVEAILPVNAISGILDGLTKILGGLINFITGVFTGNWKQAWEGVKSIFSGIWEAIKSVCTGVVNGIISVINTVIKGLNCLKIPDWVPGLGGMGINIPLIPMLAKGSDYTPDTFIAGEKGAELITNARGRTVFTAAQTGQIFENMNRAAEQSDGTTVVTMLPILQADLSAAKNAVGVAPQLQMAYAGATAGGVDAPTVTAGEQRATSVVVHSAPVFHVGTDAQAEDIEEMLDRRDEELLYKIEDREKQREDDERRRRYD